MRLLKNSLIAFLALPWLLIGAVVFAPSSISKADREILFDALNEAVEGEWLLFRDLCPRDIGAVGHDDVVLRIPIDPSGLASMQAIIAKQWGFQGTYGISIVGFRPTHGIRLRGSSGIESFWVFSMREGKMQIRADHVLILPPLWWFETERQILEAGLPLNSKLFMSQGVSKGGNP